jgi:ribose 5-phosphate isomerase B
MKKSIGNDHAGPDYKGNCWNAYRKGHQITNYGTDSDSVDPDFGHPANDVTEGKADLGIVSGSGNGMTVNKHAQVRAALCWRKRLHFNVNIR